MNFLHEITQMVKTILSGVSHAFFSKLIPSLMIPLVPSLSFLFGTDNFLAMQALLVLIVIDFITGIFSARKVGEEIKSKKAVKSAFKIGVYSLLVSSAHLAESIMPGSTFLVEAMTSFLALTELISILENAGKMGFAVPKKLLNQLHKLRDEDTTSTETITTHTIQDDKKKITETKQIIEKTEEKHVSEKPNPPKG